MNTLSTVSETLSKEKCDSLKDYFNHSVLKKIVHAFFLKYFPDVQVGSYEEEVGRILADSASMYEFLQHLSRKRALLTKLSTSQKVCFVLACEKASDLSESTPCSLENIWTLNLINIIDVAKNTNVTPESESELVVSHYVGTLYLLKEGFPVIDEEGNRVYYIQEDEENHNLAHVINSHGQDYVINKKGEIQGKEGEEQKVDMKIATTTEIPLDKKEEKRKCGGRGGKDIIRLQDGVLTHERFSKKDGEKST